MKTNAEMVCNFNKEILEISLRPKKLLLSEELNFINECVLEELTELKEAHDDNDYVAAVDALIDLVYFGYGALYKLGLNFNEINQCFSVVHCCNMQKKKGVNIRRGDGVVADAVKDDAWEKPEIKLAKILSNKGT